MKQLVCDMCGGTDLIKQEGVFVCQNCGTKYSVEEAKKMMVEGTVEVSGTVKVDSSDKLDNLYQIARRAKDDNNGENAARYYDMILVEDPSSWEAAFYVVYFKAMECKIAQIQSAAASVNNCIDTILKLIKSSVTDEVEQEEAVSEVANRTLIISTMLYNAAKNHYDGIDYQIKSKYIQEYVNNSFASFNTVYNLGNQLENFFSDRKYACDLAVSAWKAGIVWHVAILKLLDNKEPNKNEIIQYADKIRKYDSTFQNPNMSAASSGGCYIATSVYGSYDCPQVCTLRRYRDSILSKTRYGRAFICVYYAISPIVVKLFGKSKLFNSIWKNKLDIWVEKLNHTGIVSTPYKD